MNQTYRDIEVVLVDDGSTVIVLLFVNSTSVYMTLKSGYSNNRGQQLARGKGAEFTTGEWITYVDSPPEIEN